MSVGPKQYANLRILIITPFRLTSMFMFNLTVINFRQKVKYSCSATQGAVFFLFFFSILIIPILVMLLNLQSPEDAVAQK